MEDQERRRKRKEDEVRDLLFAFLVSLENSWCLSVTLSLSLSMLDRLIETYVHAYIHTEQNMSDE